MEKLIFVVFSLISLVNCNDFIVIKSPKSINFKGSSTLPANALSEIYSASLGYSIASNAPWDGLHVENPFNVAKAVVSVVIENADELNFGELQKFPMIGGDEDFEETVHAKVADHSHLAVNIDLVHRSGDSIKTTIGDLKKSPLKNVPQSLSSKDKGDREFLDEIEYLNNLRELISNLETKPAFINVRLSMNLLSKKSRVDANKVLLSLLNDFNDAIQKMYDNNALVTVVTVDQHIPHHPRIKRQAVALAENNTNPYRVANLSSPDYPVIFNIIFWFSLVLIFSLIAISLALSNVEDKDSIIYRMTGARGKKDN